MCVKYRSFPSSLNEGEQHVKIVYCHDNLFGIAFPSNIRNFIVLWCYNCTNMSTIYSSNCASKTWLKPIIFSNSTWNLFKLTIEWLYNILKNAIKDFKTSPNFLLTISPECWNLDWTLQLECQWAQVQRNIANASSACIVPGDCECVDCKNPLGI